jgi:hypothetical protein
LIGEMVTANSLNRCCEIVTNCEQARKNPARRPGLSVIVEAICLS